MKSPWTLLPGLMLAWAAGQSAEFVDPIRTDINPALRYYQAYLLEPNLADTNYQRVFKTDWRIHQPEEHDRPLAQGFDLSFKLVREAAMAKVPCDWGIDLSHGAESLLPGLAPAKKLALATRLRTLCYLQRGETQAGVEDLLAVLTLARQVSRDGVLVSALVQFAMENILASIVAENFHAWDQAALRRLEQGWGAAPPRGTVAATVRTEHECFFEWQTARLRAIQAKHGTNEPAALEDLRQFIHSLAAEGDEDKTKLYLEAAGHRVSGMLKLLEAFPPLYREAETLLQGPAPAPNPGLDRFTERVQAHANPLVRSLFPIIKKCQVKQAAIEVKTALLRAGLAYRLRGQEGLASVRDPAGDGPFQLREVTHHGQVCGFALTSVYQGRGFAEQLVFIERPGVALQVDGEQAGQPIKAEDAAR